MERLTSEKWRNADLQGVCGQNDLCAGRCESCLTPKFFVRAAKYEDSGLTPEQCKNAKTIIEAAFADDTSKAERIWELLEADKAGRVLVLPCKAGTPVWRIAHTFAEYPDKSEQYVRNDTFFLSDLPSFGKTVFRTREEAEKALEARNG